MNPSRTANIIILVAFLGIINYLNAQTPAEDSSLWTISLDSVVIRDIKDGFDIQDFIDKVRHDRSLYEAFRNLKTITYKSETSFHAYDSKGRQEAFYTTSAYQEIMNKCRWMEYFHTRAEGRVFDKKGGYEYYTLKMLDQVFFIHDTVCNEKPGNGNFDTKGLSGIDKQKQELKKLIFSPGEPANIPLMGDKTAIFNPEMRKYYDFSVASKVSGKGADCYVFTAKVKDQYQDDKDATVVREMSTWFEKENFQVVKRTYQLAYNTLAYKFDVNMDVNLTKTGGLYVPENIRYAGFWKIAFKKAERTDFTTDFYLYKK